MAFLIFTLNAQQIVLWPAPNQSLGLCYLKLKTDTSVFPCTSSNLSCDYCETAEHRTRAYCPYHSFYSF